MTSRESRPRHVAHVIGALTTGGAERSLVNYLLNSDREEFRHTVICLGARGELAATVEAAGIPVRLLRIRRRHLPISFLRLAAWLRRERVDVVHTHMFEAALWGRFAGRLAGVPVMVTTEHGPELWKGRQHLAVDRWLNRWTARHIAVARDGLEIRVRRERVRPDRIVLIPNGVAIPAEPRAPELARRVRAEFGLAPQTPVIGSVGRFVPEKAYEHLLAALALAREQVPDLRWIAIGDGPTRAEMMARARASGLDGAVIWAGLRQDVESLLPGMDVWVMSSVEEGLPVALLEAMAAACPIVSTRIGGIPDAVVAGRQAVLVPVADPAALAAAVVQLLRDPTLARQLGDAARARAVAEYSIQSVAHRIETIYREELARAAR
jgi:glycosyltransferase involved in cell wall biosynthesis